MDGLRSIHVPASTVRRVAGVVGKLALWLLPSAATVWSAMVVGVRWLGDVTTRTEVAEMVAPAVTAAKAAQANAFSLEQQVRDLQAQSTAAWTEVVRTKAEFEVDRRFVRLDIKRRGDLVDDAQRFYVRYFEAELRANPGKPHVAAKRTFELYRWKPPN